MPIKEWMTPEYGINRRIEQTSSTFSTYWDTTELRINITSGIQDSLIQFYFQASRYLTPLKYNEMNICKKLRTASNIAYFHGKNKRVLGMVKNYRSRTARQRVETRLNSLSSNRLEKSALPRTGFAVVRRPEISHSI